MTLSEQINKDLKEAMKSGDALRLSTVRSIRAQLIELTKREGGSTITPDDEMTLLLAASKKRRESIEMFEKGGRMDLADQERKELEIISQYLPKPLTREEAARIVARIAEEAGVTSAKDFGRVMPLAMKELKGKIDGKIVQELVRERIGG